MSTKTLEDYQNEAATASETTEIGSLSDYAKKVGEYKWTISNTQYILSSSSLESDLPVSTSSSSSYTSSTSSSTNTVSSSTDDDRSTTSTQTASIIYAYDSSESSGDESAQSSDDITTYINSGIETVEDTINSWLEGLSSSSTMWGTMFSKFGSTTSSVETIIATISSGLSTLINSITDGYTNGVDETSFGRQMENSWSKGSSSFLSTFANGSSGTYIVNFLTTTPLNAGSNSENLYGTRILGIPPIFNNVVDPEGKTMIKNIIRDSKYLSLTPGLPKYNGTAYTAILNDDAYHQTLTGNSMFEYLLRNGFDSSSFNKDRRYYTFQTDYDEYYSYLEAMINPVWLKMGLATTTGSNRFNLFSFFDRSYSSDGSTASETLLSQYKSIAFFINPTGAATESINNSPTSFGSSLASDVNSAGQTYQQLNYVTGMGTGGSGRNSARNIAVLMQGMRQGKQFLSNTFSNAVSGWNSGSTFLTKAALAGLGLASDAATFLGKDQGSAIQAFATSNGMQVVYPDLWSTATYTKSVNINFEFTSPYGDPLSIFQYVYVPFLSLLAFAMPRQAAENGFVSPFFVRADIPGYFTMDFGMISDMSWTKGGSNNLWTKDGLPRSISGNFSILDLYPFLSMTKRYSFLSSNPNYTSFLDNMAGLHAVYETDSATNMTDYWNRLLDRVNGMDNDTTGGLWNKYSSAEKSGHSTYANTNQGNRVKSNGSQIPWFRNASD